jgi:proline dehydrogenase
MRSVVLGIANRRFVRKAVTGGLGRRVALRFVAGEDLSHALDVIRSLNRMGADVSIDFLGENVVASAQAKEATEVCAQAIDLIHAEQLHANLSVKLTQLGLDIDAAQAYANAERLVGRAAESGTAVTLDMEDHPYTDRTIDAYLRLARAQPGAVGVAVQAYLKRTPHDLERLIAAGVHIRLCKGAYREPRRIAYRRRADIDAAFAALATRLIASHAYPMIATHDERLINHAIKQINAVGRAPGTYEFQMLYGVRRELQRRLLDQGFRLRVYVPFGSQWYPYLMRRIAERPANVRFFIRALLGG